ncbi:MAG: SprT-like domain-containing protein [Chloroflexi bacterium]|nr:SprT-like domain-containing protein [Chloroflexota bacterium]
MSGHCRSTDSRSRRIRSFRLPDIASKVLRGTQLQLELEPSDGLKLSPVLTKIETSSIDSRVAEVLSNHEPELSLPAVKVSSRMRRTLGSYHQKKKQITVGAHLLASGTGAEIDEILLHEVAHAIAHHRFPKSSAHGREFKSICIELGVPPTRTVKFPVDEWLKNERIAYECDSCGHTSLRKRKLHSIRGDCGHKFAPKSGYLVAVSNQRPPMILGVVGLEWRR